MAVFLTSLTAQRPAEAVAGEAQPVPVAVIARAIHATQSRDAAVRGAAARLLAATGDANHYPRIRKLAADPKAAARIPALLALGRLGAPGAESVLARRLQQTKTNSLEQQVAAYALALLPNEIGTAALQRLVLRLSDRGYRRHVGVWAGLLAGLHAAKRRNADPLGRGLHLDRVRALFTDRANRYGSLHRLAIGLLPIADAALVDQPVDEWLTGSDADRRRTALAVLGKLGRKGHTEDRAKRLYAMARKDRDPRVREVSIRLLTRWRDPIALEAALAGLRDSDAAVAAAAVATAYGLGGASLRTSAERQIERAGTTKRRVAMLDACPRAYSAKFLERCLAWAADRVAHDDLRVAASGVAARSDSTSIAKQLTPLFEELEDDLLLVSAARSMAKVGAVPDLAKRMVDHARREVGTSGRGPKSTTLGQRLNALLLANYPGAEQALVEAARLPTTTAREEVALLDAARRWLEQRARPNHENGKSGPAPTVTVELPAKLASALH